MSDISLHFTWLDWIAIGLALGWPGLIVGGALGALAWRRRRIVCGLLGAIAGCVAIFLVRLFYL